MELSFFNPTEWNSEPFVALIVLLILRLKLSRPSTRLQRVISETLAVGPAVFLYFLVRGFVNARFDDASANAQRIIDLETSLGIYHEVDLQQRILGSEVIVNVVNWIYIWAHWPLIAGVVIWLVLFHSREYAQYRNAMLVSGAIGMLIFATFPVTPPRLMDGLEVVDTVTQRSGSYRVFQPPGLTNPYAAMPSLHFGWNLLMGIAIYQQVSRAWIKALGIIMPSAMFLAIVLTANHYFLDGVVGGMIVLISLAAISGGNKVSRHWRRHRPVAGLHHRTPSASNAAGSILSGDRPLVVAHRAGNDVSSLHWAEESGANVVETDVWLHRGRLEVRHTKTLGPIPVLWDRWSLHSARTPRFLLHELLTAARPETLLMLDLKGRNSEISQRVIADLAEHHSGRPILICSQNWKLLEPFRNYRDATIVHSIGNHWQLRRAWGHIASEDCDAVSIQYRLLDDELAALIKERVPYVFTWAINTPERYRQVVAWDLDGVITDDLVTVSARRKPSEQREVHSIAGIGKTPASEEAGVDGSGYLKARGRT